MKLLKIKQFLPTTKSKKSIERYVRINNNVHLADLNSNKIRQL